VFIGRWFGIDLYLDASWFLIAAIVTYTLATSYFPTLTPELSSAVHLAMGALAAALFFASILLHELGHSVVSQRCGIPVPRITLLLIGGLAEISREPDDPKSELKIALGGPVVSVVLVVIYGVLAKGCALLGWTSASVVLLWLAWANFSLVVFNMIPGYPLDGGRVLRALLWARWGALRRATFITSRIGIAFSWVLIGLGVFLIAGMRMWNGFVFLLIAFFLKAAAESGYGHAVQREILGDKRVRDVMTASPIVLRATLPLNLAIDDFFLANHHVAYPVCDDDGMFRGLLRLEFLKAVPRERWPYVTAGDLAAESGSAELQVDANAPAMRAMRLLLAPGRGRLAVVEDGKVVGMITRHDVLHFIEIQSELTDEK
jgi:Zn-dependent protease